MYNLSILVNYNDNNYTMYDIIFIIYLLHNCLFFVILLINVNNKLLSKRN